MQGNDRLRRNGYTVALLLGLAAMFALMTGAGWTAAALGLAGMAVIAIVERITEMRQGRPGLAARQV